MKQFVFLLLVLVIGNFTPSVAQVANYKNITPDELPAGTKIIPKNAFQGRDDLVEVTIPEGVEIIEEFAFNGCRNLQKVVLPSTLIRANNAFNGCNNLKDVTCLGIVPPSLVPLPKYYGKNNAYYGIEPTRYVYYSNLYNRKVYDTNAYGLYGYNLDSDYTVRDDVYPYDQVVYLNYMMRGHTLSHPACTPYDTEVGWNHFPAFKHLDIGWPSKLRVGNRFTLLQNLPTNKPDLTLAVGMDNDNKVYYAGHMTLDTDGTLSVGMFNIEQDAWQNGLRILGDRSYTTTTVDNCWPTLYTMSPMRADKVKTTLRLDEKTYKHTITNWMHMALPFDCRVSDIKFTGDNLQWAIRKYSGKMRADAKFDEVWVRQTADSILHANEGFIIAVGWNVDNCPTASIEMSAINNANKNRIFTPEDVSIPLQQYIASAESDRSWNFIGNPYPCFYSTKYFEPAMPFVVYEKDWWNFKGWNLQTVRYITYSPVDDNYVLHPFQGFFVQRPLGYDALNFPEYGRFATIDEFEDFYAELTSDVDYSRASRRRAAIPRPPVGIMENRRVINIHLQDAYGYELDRTRLVGNPDASTLYETACDATKFPDLTATSASLYIVGDDNTHYAISEQPFAEGDEISLGARFTAAGTYTLQASFKNEYPDLEGKVMLIDHETGTTQSATEPYTFTAQAGETTTRFALAYDSNATGIALTADAQLPVNYCYDLQGRLVKGTPRPGIYIKNGKKIIIK